MEFLVIKTENKDTILLGKKTLEDFEKNEKEIKELKLKYEKLFNNEPSKGYEGYECEINTVPGKKYTSSTEMCQEHI